MSWYAQVLWSQGCGCSGTVCSLSLTRPGSSYVALTKLPLGWQCSCSCSLLSTNLAGSCSPPLLLSVVSRCLMAHCGSSEPSAEAQAPRPDSNKPSQVSVDQSRKPVLFEIFGEIWTVQSRLGQGVSASVYRVSSGRATATAAVKEFQTDTQGGDYGYHKERSVLESIQGHKNIGNDMVFTILL